MHGGWDGGAGGQAVREEPETAVADVDPRDVPSGQELADRRKLFLVLDIDHTLVDCVKVSEVSGTWAITLDCALPRALLGRAMPKPHDNRETTGSRFAPQVYSGYHVPASVAYRHYRATVLGL